MKDASPVGAQSSAAASEYSAEKAKGQGAAGANTAAADLGTKTDSRATGKAKQGLDISQQYLVSVYDCAEAKKAAKEFEALLQFGQVRKDCMEEIGKIVTTPDQPA